MKNLSLTFCLMIAALFGSVGGGFASDLPPCKGESMWSDHHCFGTFIFENGKYIGEFKNGRMHGKGNFYWDNGNHYVGELRNNDFNGLGTYTYADGTVEEGMWKDDEFQYAKKLSPPVPVAKAPTQDDEIISASEYSLLVEEDGDSFMYITRLVDGTKLGTINQLGGYKWLKKTFGKSQSPRIFIQPKNVSTSEDQDSYTQSRYEIFNFSSEFSENRNGDQFLSFHSKEAISDINSFISKNERLTFAGLTSETWYVGIFSPVNQVSDLLALAKSNPDGFCFLMGLSISNNTRNRQLNSSNLSELMSNNGVECGPSNNVVYHDSDRSIPTIKTPTQYDEIISASSGSDLPDCPSSGNLHNCFGTYTYAHGSKYVGEFRDNEFNGQGTFKYSSGTEYIGEFKNGKFNGQGILTYADGTVEDGFWKDDAFVGK